MAAATTSRRLCFMLSILCLVSFVNSMGVKEKLAHMKQILAELQENMKIRMAEHYAEREVTQDIIDGNTVKMNYLKQMPIWSDPEVQEVVEKSERDNDKARRFFQQADEKMKFHTSQVQEFVDYIKYLESMQDASYAFSM